MYSPSGDHRSCLDQIHQWQLSENTPQAFPFPPLLLLYPNPWELTWHHICSVNHPLFHICSQISSLSPPQIISLKCFPHHTCSSLAQNSFHVFSSILQKNMNCVWSAMLHTTEPILVPATFPSSPHLIFSPLFKYPNFFP